MLNALSELFSNSDYFAECASKVHIQAYKNVMRSKHISSDDGSEEGAYFCAVPKTHCASAQMAVSVLFINSLYDFEIWDKDNRPFDNFNRIEWKGYLKDHWIPEYFSWNSTLSLEYEQADFVENLPLADNLLPLAIPSPALVIVRYGMIHAWNSFDYLIETETEYINFQSWTTA